MKVYRNIDELPKIKNAIVTQGTFDGVHAAHQVILRRLKELAWQYHGETVVITYDPHPRMVLYPEDHGLKLLQTLDEKTEALRQEGVDHLVVIPFTRKFSRLSSLEFIRDVIVNKIGTKVLVIGYNHRFGKNREGTFSHLKEYSARYGFEIEEIPEHDIDNVSVSSSKIRKAIESGDIATANKYLLKPYIIHGIVERGKQLGKTIGFPTANIHVDDPNKLIPADGVYAVKVFIKNGKDEGKFYPGMLNSGFRPTVNGKGHSIEVHLFNFDSDLYGGILAIEFVEKLRDEKRFGSITELKNQLEKDKLHAIEKLSTLN